MRKIIESVSYNVALNFASQTIVLGSVFILSRIYNIEEYGRFATHTAIAAVMSIFSTYRLEIAALSVKNRIESDELLSSSFTFCIIFSILAIPASSIFIDADEAFVVSLLTVSMGIYQILISRYIIVESVIDISKSRLFNTIITLILQIFFSFYTEKDGLSYGLIIGYLVSMIYMGLFKFLRFDIKLLLNHLSSQRSFGLLSTISAGINSITMQAPQFALNHFFGGGVAGNYAIAQRFTVFPLSLISQPLGQSYSTIVFHHRQNNKGFLKYIDKYFSISLAISIIFIALINIIIPPVIRTLFPPNWQSSLKYIMPCSLLLLPTLIMGTIGNSLNLMRRTKQQMIWETARLVLTLLVIFIFSRLNKNSVQLIEYYSIIIFVFSLIFFYWARLYAAKEENNENIQ